MICDIIVNDIEIEEWVRKHLAAGYSPEQIRASLKKSGYDPTTVDRILIGERVEVKPKRQISFMKIDLSKLDFKKSVLLVAGVTAAIAIISLVITSKNITINPSLPFFSIPSIAGFAILISLVSIGLAVLSWWIHVVLTDYTAVKIFKLQINYDNLVPAFAICYTLAMVVNFVAALISSGDISATILSFAIIVINLLIYTSAIHSIYTAGWFKSFLIYLVTGLVVGVIMVVGSLVGGIVGASIAMVIL